MEEEMINVCNIMPVELAIKRELAYRAKMEALQNQHLNDLKPLVLTQPVKPLETARVTQGPPPQARREHAEVGPSNSQKSPMLQISSSSQMLKEKVVFTCKACKLNFASVFHLSSHVESQLHKVNISQMKKRKLAFCNPIWCELCRCSFSSLVEVEAHLNGSKHNNALAFARNCKRKKR